MQRRRNKKGEVTKAALHERSFWRISGEEPEGGDEHDMHIMRQFLLTPYIILQKLSHEVHVVLVTILRLLARNPPEAVA